MNELCDLCGSDRLMPVHEPEGTARGLTVYMCSACGLVQSLPRIDRVSTRPVNVSAAADWGNVRYGKSFRLEATFAALARATDVTGVRQCLDIGSSRGSFALELLNRASAAEVYAVEPDGAIVTPYAATARIKLFVGRIEDAPLAGSHFDLVHCSHTLEHVTSPRAVLAQIRRAVSAGGLIFIEVPRLAFIGEPDVIEEWFLDKHLYHFSASTLTRYLGSAGFHLHAQRVQEDVENVTLIAAPSSGPSVRTLPDPQEVERTLALIARYQRARASNRIKLRQAVRALMRLGRTRVVVWGAGRLFDSLVRFGGLDPGWLAGVVDTHLGKYVESVHGRPVVDPRRLPALQPDLVVIASRAYYAEIRRAADALVPGCTIVGLNDLLEVPVHVAAGRV